VFTNKVSSCCFHKFYHWQSFCAIHWNLNAYRVSRTPSSGMLRRVAPVRTDVSDELSATFLWVTRIGELGTTLPVTSNRHTLWRNTKWALRSMCRLLVTANVLPSSPILVTLRKVALRSSETSALIGATWHNIPQYGILHSHRRENLKSYTYRVSAEDTHWSNSL
jgi:hypothetical protein